MRILVVEDEKKVADMIARGLKAEGYAVDVALDGQSGWDMATPATTISSFWISCCRN